MNDHYKQIVERNAQLRGKVAIYKFGYECMSALALAGWVAFVIAIALPAEAHAGDDETYEQGYSDGYQDSACNYESMCNPPVAPVPPVPPYGSDYNDGYREGMEDGDE